MAVNAAVDRRDFGRRQTVLIDLDVRGCAVKIGAVLPALIPSAKLERNARIGEEIRGIVSWHIRLNGGVGIQDAIDVNLRVAAIGLNSKPAKSQVGPDIGRQQDARCSTPSVTPVAREQTKDLAIGAAESSLHGITRGGAVGNPFKQILIIHDHRRLDPERDTEAK